MAERPRLKQGFEALCEQVGVARPACRDIGPVLDDEGRRVVVAGSAPAAAWAGVELGRVVQDVEDLVLDVGGIGAVVAAEPPGGGEVGGSLQRLREAGRPR